jgi:hypothetical protein
VLSLTIPSGSVTYSNGTRSMIRSVAVCCFVRPRSALLSFAATEFLAHMDARQ